MHLRAFPCKPASASSNDPSQQADIGAFCEVIGDFCVSVGGFFADTGDFYAGMGDFCDNSVHRVFLNGSFYSAPCSLHIF